MLHNKNILILFIIIVAASSPVQAQNEKSVNVVTTAVPFLKVSMDVRAGGMGNTGIATDPDVNAVYWNLGKIPFTESSSSLVANYTPWLRKWANDMYMASVAGYYKLDE